MVESGGGSDRAAAGGLIQKIRADVLREGHGPFEVEEVEFAEFRNDEVWPTDAAFRNAALSTTSPRFGTRGLGRPQR
jgi:hypothetical protein